MFERAVGRAGAVIMLATLTLTAIMLPVRSAVAAGPAWTIVVDESTGQATFLSKTESFDLIRGLPAHPSADELSGRSFLRVYLYWSPAAEVFQLGSDGELTSFEPEAADQDALPYLGTETAPPLLAFLNPNPFGWPTLSSAKHYILGPAHVALLARHGLPATLVDPHTQAPAAANPVPILVDAFPATGTGGLADEGSAGTSRIVLVLVPALAIMFLGLYSLYRTSRQTQN